MVKKRILMFLKYFILIIASLLSVFPLFWMIVSATNKSTDVIAGRLLPGTWLIENLQNLLKASNLGTAMKNSFQYAIVTTVGSVIICSLAGYAFELYHDKVKDKVHAAILLSMMIPMAATIIPLFTLFGRWNLLNGTLGFALPSLSTAILIFLFRQSTRSFPYSIIEAARIEGAGEISIFLRVYLPVMRPTYAAAITVAFMNAWNSYLWPLIIMQTKESITMPILISNLTSGYVTDYGMLMLAVTISTLPTIIIFLVLQRNFVEGITGSFR